ncbi:MAG: CYTH domain-containing protein [Ilumatobacteraceae bacterium]
MATGEHVEVELKLYVPASRVAAVEAALRSEGPVHEVLLRAEYVDTADWHLSQHGLTWRVRHEDERWVQTLKARVSSADDIERIEHDVDVTDRVGGRNDPPSPDPTLHRGTQVGKLLIEVLDEIAARGDCVVPRFTTDVHRTERLAATPNGTVLLSLDRGEIRAGSASTPVSELEIELVDGTPDAVHHAAAEWAARFDLVRDHMNKARRGRLLADGVLEDTDERLALRPDG